MYVGHILMNQNQSPTHSTVGRRVDSSPRAGGALPSSPRLVTIHMFGKLCPEQPKMAQLMRAIFLQNLDGKSEKKQWTTLILW